MTEEFDVLVDSSLDELKSLKLQADTLGIKYSNNIGVDSLREKVLAKREETSPKEAVTSVVNKQSELTRKSALRKDMRAEELKLVRCRITCLNPSKQNIPGEIVTVANKLLGKVSRFVPFNSFSDSGELNEQGTHIEHCLYVSLKNRKYHKVVTEKKNGQIRIKGQYQTPEFNIEVLEPLTPAQLKKLAEHQAAAQRVMG
jgi:hypothetical protein